MTSYAALTTLAGQASAEDLAEALEALGPTGVGCFEIEDGAGRWEVGAYFSEQPDAIQLALLAAAFEAAPFAISKIPPKDWVSHVQRELTPVRAGRVIVHGAHDRANIPVNAVGLEIEAAMAFGTGHHATTEGCLLALDALKKCGMAPRRALDIGCGTGVLAMATARLWPGVRMVATDIDPTAAEAAAANARANGVHPLIATGCAPGFRHRRIQAARPVDLILANILATPLKHLAPEMARALAPGGVAVLSGLSDAQAAGVAGRYRAWGFS